MSNKYDDIINLPYEKSKTHPHMSNSDRAAQFAPFAALTGYEELIRETARKTEKKIMISSEKKIDISNKLEYISSLKDNDIDINIIYFVKDKTKSGGKYVEETTKRIKIDSYHKTIRFNSSIVKIDDIFDVNSKLFR